MLSNMDFHTNLPHHQTHNDLLALASASLDYSVITHTEHKTIPEVYCVKHFNVKISSRRFSCFNRLVGLLASSCNGDASVSAGICV